MKQHNKKAAVETEYINIDNIRSSNASSESSTESSHSQTRLVKHKGAQNLG